MFDSDVLVDFVLYEVLYFVHEYGDVVCMSAVRDMRSPVQWCSVWSVYGCIYAVFGVCAVLANR